MMNRLAIKIIIYLHTLGLFPKGFSGEDPIPTSVPPLPENCKSVPPEIELPNFSNLTLNEVLSYGIHQMNFQTRNLETSRKPLNGTFVFGEVGSHKKSFVTYLYQFHMRKLGFGLSKENISVFFRNETNNLTTDFQKIMPLIPTYIVDDFGWKRGSSYHHMWDCPGFNFNSKTKADIAQTYFLKHALEITQAANFLFTMTYSSLIQQDDFRRLATYATTLIKNVSTFNNSIGLVVIEVPKVNCDDCEYEMELVVRNALNLFIEDENIAIREIENQGGSSLEITMIEQRILFAEVLLLFREEKPYIESRISIILNEDYWICGSWEASFPSVAIFNKMYYYRGILNNLQHVPYSSENFGFTMSTDTIFEIEQALQEVDFKEEEKYAVNTTIDLTNLLEKLLNEDKNGIPKLTLLEGFMDTFYLNFGKLFDKTLGNEPSKVILYSDIKDLDAYMTCASQRLKTIQFFQDVMTGKYEGAPIPTYAPLFETVDSGLNDFMDYFDFCKTIYTALGEPKNQLIIKKLKNETGENFLNNNTVLKFLKMAKFAVPSKINASWQMVGYEHQQYLVEMVRNYMPEFIVRSVGDCQRTDVIGKYVFLSNALSWYKNTGSCSREVSLIAKEKVYLDADLNVLYPYTEEEHILSISSISVVAPVWEVVSTRTGYRDIRLSYNSGFFGIYSKIFNSNQLIIYTHGNPGSIYLESFGANVTIRSETYEHNPSIVNEEIYKPSHGQSNYIAAFEDRYLIDCHSLDFQIFFWNFRSNPQLNNRMEMYTPIYLVNELKALEGNYSILLNGDYSLKCPDNWKTLSERIYSYYDNIMQVIVKRMESAKEQDQLSFRIIGTFVHSRTLNLRRLEKTLNVISTESYLAALLEDLALIEKLELKSAINEESNEYQNALNEKVKEAESLIGNTIQPAIQSAEAALKSMNIKMLETINAFIHAAEEHEKKMKEMRDEFKKMLPWKHVMSVLTMVGTAVTLLAPPGVGQIVGAGLIAGANIGNSFLDGQVNLKPLLTFTDVVADTIDSIPEDDLGDQDTDPELKFKAKDVANAINLGVEVLEGVVGCVNEIINNENKLDELDKAVKDAEAQVKVMENMKNQFENQFAPMLNKMAGDISGEKLNGTSQAGLTVKKFQMKNKLKGMRKMVHSFVGPISEAQNNSKDSGEPVIGEPAVYENFLASIETLEEALVVLFEMYTHIENYQERKEFAQFIANINNPTTGIGKILDEDLRLGLQRLERGIRTNLLLEEYKKAEHAVKQFVFPFGRDYLMKKNHQFGLTPESTLTEVVDACSRGIRDFLGIIRKYNAITTFNDQFVFYANFTSRLLSSKPFFVWRNEQWNTTIHRLFNGSSIQLMADCNQTGHENEKFFANKTAIKFKGINMYLKTHDKSRQVELNEVLNNFQISMTHSGVSLYLVNRQQFVMRDSKQTYRYNFEGDSSQNLIRYKVTSPSSDFLMSPYTWWTLQIRDLTGNGFNDLFAFATEVDLELEGTGLYLDEEIAGNEVLNELHVADFYSSFEPEVNRTLTNIDNTTESPHHNCSRRLLSNFPYLTEFETEVETPSNDTSDEPTESQYDDFTDEESQNRNVWSDRFEDFQQIPKTRFPGSLTERSEKTRDYIAMTGEDEAQAATNEKMPTYELEPVPPNEEEEETEEDQEERETREEEKSEWDQNAPHNNFLYHG